MHTAVVWFLHSFGYDFHILDPWEVLWPSGRASDSGARGLGFDPHSGRLVVSLSKIHLPLKKYW